ncbi:hypothetical protein CR513_12370, partial [Mucuna pruriens]
MKEKLDSGLIVTHVPTGLQVVDVFTRGLPATRFQELPGKLGMIYSFTNLRESVRDIDMFIFM